MNYALDPLPWLVALLGWMTLVCIAALIAAARYTYRARIAQAQRQGFLTGYHEALASPMPGAVAKGLTADEERRAYRLVQQVWSAPAPSHFPIG